MKTVAYPHPVAPPDPVSVSGRGGQAGFRQLEGSMNPSRLPIPSRSRDGEGGQIHANQQQAKDNYQSTAKE